MLHRLKSHQSTSSTAQSGGGSFQNRKPIRSWLAGLQRWQSNSMPARKPAGTCLHETGTFDLEDACAVRFIKEFLNPFVIGGVSGLYFCMFLWLLYQKVSESFRYRRGLRVFFLHVFAVCFIKELLNPFAIGGVSGHYLACFFRLFHQRASESFRYRRGLRALFLHVFAVCFIKEFLNPFAIGGVSGLSSCMLLPFALSKSF